ncbi:YJU2 splicing factor like protein [Nosema granulosis]|uniref:YJU2 splicing factor like protein n=1 Tax=Nosema granulosis TaxID=83296 RepID=A0A9P6H2M6_9MICR|nr:YJU2 splicing factor like protein [Nosema granulosis]
MSRRKTKKSSFEAHAVRFATPFTIKCTKCGEYIAKNKRHNAIKEIAIGEDFHGVKSYRFYIKCTNCKITMSIKTNPEKGEYITEIGCTRIDEIQNSEATIRDSTKISLEQEIESLKEDVYTILKNEKYLKYDFDN